MAFVMGLRYSRMLILCFYLGAARPQFIDGRVQACIGFNGVARIALYENLRSTVLERVDTADHGRPCTAAGPRLCTYTAPYRSHCDRSAATMTESEELIWLVARQQIADVIYRYARGIDRLDLELVRACYHPDAYDDHGSMGGTVDEFIAAAATFLHGGTPAQIEDAAEMGLEHFLGLTCDPVGGMVQVPCIERNAFAAMRAMDCAAFALATDGRHAVSLDNVIDVMGSTGRDLQAKYRETARGGLAAIMKDRLLGERNE